MGQRNEKSLEEKMDEAEYKLEEYRKKAIDASHPNKRKLYQMKAAKCRHFIEFSRWQLGIEKELEL